jgi:hypothetical protein
MAAQAPLRIPFACIESLLRSRPHFEAPTAFQSRSAVLAISGFWDMHTSIGKDLFVILFSDDIVCHRSIHCRLTCPCIIKSCCLKASIVSHIHMIHIGVSGKVLQTWGRFSIVASSLGNMSGHTTVYRLTALIAYSSHVRRLEDCQREEENRCRLTVVAPAMRCVKTFYSGRDLFKSQDRAKANQNTAAKPVFQAIPDNLF